MSTASLSPVYNELLDYLVAKASPEEILAFQPSAAAQTRAEILTEKNKAGTLTATEHEELAQLLQMDALVSALKAKALASLGQE